MPRNELRGPRRNVLLVLQLQDRGRAGEPGKVEACHREQGVKRCGEMHVVTRFAVCQPTASEGEDSFPVLVSVADVREGWFGCSYGPFNVHLF